MRINRLISLFVAICCFFIYPWLGLQCMEFELNDKLIRNYQFSEKRASMYGGVEERIVRITPRSTSITHDLNYENPECFLCSYCYPSEKTPPQRGDNAICSNTYLKIKGVESKGHIEFEQIYCSYSGIYESENNLKITHPHAKWCLAEEPSWYRCFYSLLCCSSMF